MIKIIAFDAFGTLFNFDQKSISDTQGAAVPDILDYARRKQLEYTWLHSLMGRHKPFDQITVEVLRDAVTIYGGDEALVQRLAALYLHPICFEDVAEGLASLQALPIKKGILSNGTIKMLESGINKNILSDSLDFVLSADAAGIFKPSARVYQLVLDAFPIEKEEVLFVSSNPWDVAGASRFGFHCAWLNRKKGKPESLLREAQYIELNSLEELTKTDLLVRQSG